MFTQARLIVAALVLTALVGSFVGLYLWGNSWHNKYVALASEDLAQQLADQKAATLALAQQIATRDQTLATNQQVIDDLSKKHAADVANLGATGELVNRLLHHATHISPPSITLPETGRGPAADATAVNDGDGRVNGLLVRVAAEYWEHYRQCSALQAEIGPQR